MRRVSCAALALLLLACSGGGDAPRAGFRPLNVGDRAPAYVARTLAGDSVRVGAGRPYLLNVWATWCTSCKEEMADLAALERDYASKGVKVLAVSVDVGNGERVRRFVETEKLPFMVAHDPSADVQQAFQAVGVPETYLVGADGTLLWVRRGGIHGLGDSLRVSLDRAVAKLQ